MVKMGPVGEWVFSPKIRHFQSGIKVQGRDSPSSTITVVTTSIVFSMEKCQLETKIVQWGSENRTCRDLEWSTCPDFKWCPVFEWFGIA